MDPELYSRESLEKYLRPTFSPEVTISRKPVHVVTASDVKRIEDRLEPILRQNAYERAVSEEGARRIFTK
jgi:hypothetical protein